MTNQQILERAIQKAVDGGWDVLDKYEANQLNVQQDVFEGNYVVAFLANDEPSGREILQHTFHWTEIIFNHDFAKALWGKSTFVHAIHHKTGEPDFPLWQYHLQQMVIAEDPIKYLGDTL